MNRTTIAAALLLATGASGLAGCSSGGGAHAGLDEPFSFAEVRALAQPIDTLPPGQQAALVAHLRRNGPRVARIYTDALTRFEGIYGDGVGPAKRSPEYLDCKSAFHRVGTLINTIPTTANDEALVALWDQLALCRTFARQWSDPAEMATFGKDIMAMTDGAMLVLGYAASASGSPLGARFHAEIQNFEGTTSGAD